MRLASVPLVQFPSTITIGATVYTEGVHYFVVVDTTTLAGSIYETSGLEWFSTGPASGTEMTLIGAVEGVVTYAIGMGLGHLGA